MTEANLVPCHKTKKKRVGLLPCSGACNVGMLTTQTVVDLTTEYDNINFVCALGLPLGIKGIIDNAKKSEIYIALNGCDVKCSTRALYQAGIKTDHDIVVTKDLGISKNKSFSDLSGLAELKERVHQLIESVDKPTQK